MRRINLGWYSDDFYQFSHWEAEEWRDFAQLLQRMDAVVKAESPTTELIANNHQSLTRWLTIASTAPKSWIAGSGVASTCTTCEARARGPMSLIGIGELSCYCTYLGSEYRMFCNIPKVHLTKTMHIVFYVLFIMYT